MNIKQITVTLAFAQAAQAYLDAQQITKALRLEYQTARDAYLFDVVGGDQSHDWSEITQQPEFQLRTGKAFNAWKRAKRQQYNAERRMNTQYRRLAGGVA